MEKEFKDRLTKKSIIASVKNEQNLDLAIKSDSEIVFLLSGSISTLKDTIKKVKAAGKIVFVHFDLIDGFGRDSAAIHYLCEEFHPDGIISTKNQIIRVAKECGLITVQRFFLLDSISLAQCLKIATEAKPSAIEIMPGVMPNIIREISDAVPTPVIVGGLVRKESEIQNALQSGAKGVSVSDPKLW